jgi:hypothetical protein
LGRDHFLYPESGEMMIDLFKPNAEGALEIVGSVGFHNVPLTTVADLYCTPRGILSFARAIEVSGHLAMNEAVGTIDEYQWRCK